jgi:hypothetical protein
MHDLLCDPTTFKHRFCSECGIWVSVKDNYIHWNEEHPRLILQYKGKTRMIMPLTQAAPRNSVIVNFSEVCSNPSMVDPIYSESYTRKLHEKQSKFDSSAALAAVIVKNKMRAQPASAKKQIYKKLVQKSKFSIVRKFYIKAYSLKFAQTMRNFKSLFYRGPGFAE